MVTMDEKEKKKYDELRKELVLNIRLANPLSFSVQPRGKTGSCAELYG